MPDIVIEMFEPWDELAVARWKAEVYLRQGANLFWLVRPTERGNDVSHKDRAGKMQTEFCGIEDKLSGENILPGFELPVSRIFAALRE